MVMVTGMAITGMAITGTVTGTAITGTVTGMAITTVTGTAITGMVTGMAWPWTQAWSWRALVAWSLLGLWRRLMLALDPRWLYLDLRLLSSGQRRASASVGAFVMRGTSAHMGGGLMEPFMVYSPAPPSLPFNLHSYAQPLS